MKKRKQFLMMGMLLLSTIATTYTSTFASVDINAPLDAADITVTAGLTPAIVAPLMPTGTAPDRVFYASYPRLPSFDIKFKGKEIYICLRKCLKDPTIQHWARTVSQGFKTFSTAEFLTIEKHDDLHISVTKLDLSALLCDTYQAQIFNGLTENPQQLIADALSVDEYIASDLTVHFQGADIPFKQMLQHYVQQLFELSFDTTIVQSTFSAITRLIDDVKFCADEYAQKVVEYRNLYKLLASPALFTPASPSSTSAASRYTITSRGVTSIAKIKSTKCTVETTQVDADKFVEAIDKIAQTITVFTRTMYAAGMLYTDFETKLMQEAGLGATLTDGINLYINGTITLRKILNIELAKNRNIIPDDRFVAFYDSLFKDTGLYQHCLNLETSYTSSLRLDSFADPAKTVVTVLPGNDDTKEKEKGNYSRSWIVFTNPQLSQERALCGDFLPVTANNYCAFQFYKTRKPDFTALAHVSIAKMYARKSSILLADGTTDAQICEPYDSYTKTTDHTRANVAIFSATQYEKVVSACKAATSCLQSGCTLSLHATTSMPLSIHAPAAYGAYTISNPDGGVHGGPSGTGCGGTISSAFSVSGTNGSP